MYFLNYNIFYILIKEIKKMTKTWFNFAAFCPAYYRICDAEV